MNISAKNFVTRSILAVFGLICIMWISQPTFGTEGSFDIGSKFASAGWMGDGKLGKDFVLHDESSSDNSRDDSRCIRVQYKKFGQDGWAGVYWQNKAENWGDLPGEDWSKSGYEYLLFWAKGDKGNEYVEFKAGGISDNDSPYKDSFEASLGKIRLRPEWTLYCLPLSGKNLSSVIGGFAWIANNSGNSAGLTFYLDDIRFVSASEYDRVRQELSVKGQSFELCERT